MKKLTIILIIALMAVFRVSEAGAWSLELTPSGQIDVTGETSIFVDIWFNPDVGGSRLDNYAFNLSYDTSELTWDEGQTDYYAPFPLYDNLLGYTTEPSAGFIQNINAATFGDGATLNETTLLASIAFDILTPVGDSSPDVWFDTTEYTNVTVNGISFVMDVANITGGTPDIAIVPEPISSALFIVGGATLGFRRFRKKFMK